MGADKTPRITAEDAWHVHRDVMHATAEDAAARAGESLEEGKRRLSREAQAFWAGRVKAGRE